MYPVGVLFGLGFDTATEVALLVLAGSAVVGGLPFYAILALPVLFAAGMCLFDTLDGCFMNFAYDWAFANPVRKVFYNLTITGLSVAVAFFVGTIEILGLIAQEANLSSPLWDFVRGFNINMAGYVIVGLFVVTWVAALAYWRLARVEERMTLEPAPDRADSGELSLAPDSFANRMQEVRVELIRLERPSLGRLRLRWKRCTNCRSAVQSPMRQKRHADGRSVSQVTVQIGHLRQVVPDALQFSWEIVATTTADALTEAELIVEEVPAVVECPSCSARTTLDMPILACGSCGSFDVTLVSGEELRVVLDRFGGRIAMGRFHVHARRHDA